MSVARVDDVSIDRSETPARERRVNLMRVQIHLGVSQRRRQLLEAGGRTTPCQFMCEETSVILGDPACRHRPFILRGLPLFGNGKGQRLENDPALNALVQSPKSSKASRLRAISTNEDGRWAREPGVVFAATGGAATSDFDDSACIALAASFFLLAMNQGYTKVRDAVN
jgi:hypothetical protein